ncbi:MAG: transporter, partial [Leptolyngbya sp.]
MWRSRAGGVLLVLILLIPGAGLQAQEEASPAEPAPAPALAGPAPSLPEPAEDAVFFADVLVRGQPVFQVGSLTGLSASDRAQIINRRIGGLLSQAQELDAVTVQVDEGRQIALLTVNNRVLMTVTQQDATDFGLTVEALAQQWADRLNQVLAQPNLVIDVLQRLDGTARQLVDDTIVLLPSLMGAIVLVGLTWIVALGVR